MGNRLQLFREEGLQVCDLTYECVEVGQTCPSVSLSVCLSDRTWHM